MNLVTSDTKTAIAIPSSIEEVELNHTLIHQVTTHYLGGQRQGSAKQKNRSEVSGGGIKPWRQKGTGRARFGSSRNPIWRKGGVTFAARGLRKYGGKLNKKMFRGALSQLIANKIKENKLFVLEDTSFPKPNTKTFINKMNDIKIPLTSTLFVLDENSVNFCLSSRNIPHVTYCQNQDINPYLLLKYDNLVFKKDVLEKSQFISL